MEYYSWREHLGHALEVRESKRTVYSGVEESEEEAVAVWCTTCGQQVFLFGPEAVVRWTTGDVQSVAELTPGEAEVVLDYIERNADAETGVNWRALEAAVRELYPEARPAEY